MLLDLTCNAQNSYNVAMPNDFSTELRRWRGKRLQKEAAELLGIGLRTYHSWEQGRRKPTAPSMQEIKRRMYGS